MNAVDQAVYRRHSLLKRNTSLTRPAFFAHYLDTHGPLAATLPGFRRYAYRYVQNHVEADLAGGEPPFDGITITYQVPRADYRRGFFQTPDYAKVRPDEEYLFDLAATVSLLGREEIVLERASGAAKAIVMTSGLPAAASLAARLNADLPTAARVIVNRLDAAGAVALGGPASSFSHDSLVEIWFDTDAARGAVAASGRLLAAFGGAPAIALAIREHVIFTGDRPEFLVE